MTTYLVALICVAGMALGQILFKMCAMAARDAGSPLEVRAVSLLVVALVLYGVTTLVWIWVLQRIDLGKIYPFMALAFVLVPIGSHLVFGERFSTQYFFGVAFIVIGIVIIAKSQV